MEIENEDKNHEINSNKEVEIVGGNSKQIQIMKLGEETWNNITTQTHKLEN